MEPEKIRISVPHGFSSLPAFYLSENSDLDIETVIHKNKNIVINRLMKKEVEMALLPTNEAMKLYNKGIDIQISNIHTWGVFYILSTDPKIKNWDDLKGKEIYVPERGGPMDIIFSYLAKVRGLNLKNDLNIMRGKPMQISKLMINDMTDTVVLREPFVSQVLLNNKKARIVINLQNEWQKVNNLRLPQASLVVRKDFAQNSPELIKKFEREYARAIDSMLANVDESAEIAKKYMKIALEVSNAGIPRSNLHYRRAIDVKDEINNYIKLMKEYKPEIIGGELANEEIYYKWE